MGPLRVGMIPEHFSTPLIFAKDRFKTDITLVEIPEGTGRLMEAMEGGEIDVAIGLTEGFVAGLAKGRTGFQIVGSYVASPLCWVVSTGQESKIQSLADIKDGTIGVSRYGSGSHVMSYVLAQREGWDPERLKYKVLDNFKGLRDGVNAGIADCFMWERFTSKRYLDAKEIREVGEIYSPWASWLITARSDVLDDPRLHTFLDRVNDGVSYFQTHHEEAVSWIASNLDYSVEDARQWLGTVRFTSEAHSVNQDMLKTTLSTLRLAGVVETDHAEMFHQV